MSRHLLRTTAVAAAAAALLAACGGGSEVTSASTSPSGDTVPETSQTATPSTSAPSPSEPSHATASSASPAAPEDEATEPSTDAAPFEADTSEDTGEATGGPLSVVAVRAAHHDGFDRVVFELDGQEAGQPGWRVGYVDEPSQQGSGDAVEVDGSAYLQVMLTGTGYPFDTGAEEFTGTTDPSGTTAVEQVVTGGVYEGQAQAFIGLDSEQPFRVFRLENPARVVVDVQTS